MGWMRHHAIIVTSCIVLYVAALALQPDAIFRVRGLFSFLSPGTRALYQLGMTGGVAWREGWWWTMLTAIYHMLKTGTVHHDLGADHFDRRSHESQTKRLVAQLARLGYQVHLEPVATAA